MDAIPRRRLLKATAATAATGAMLLTARPAQAGPPPHRPPRLPDLGDPVIEDVSVHDPSVIVAGGTTYVFGSHLAAAKSDDLLVWEQVADLVTPENPLFADVSTELAEAFDTAQSATR